MSRKEEQALKLDAQLCFPLYAASNLLTRLYRPLLDELGLTYPQYLVLSVLWEDDGLTITTIANRLALEPSSITPLVKRLEKAGLFPKRVRLGPNSVAWVEAEIEAWQKAKADARGTASAV